MRKTFLALVAAAGLAAAAAALAPNPQARSTGALEREIGWTRFNPAYSTSHSMKACPDGPVECGLIVW